MTTGSVADRLTREEMAEYKDAFEMFDMDGGGTIESHELKHVMGKLGEAPTDEELADMIFRLDKNGDGVIDFEEFVEMMLEREEERKHQDPEQALRDAFNLFDADKSGFIDRNEVRLLMKKLAQSLKDEEVDAIMEEADIDGDGKISFDEFSTMMFG